MLKLKLRRIKTNLIILLVCWAITAVCAYFAVPAIVNRFSTPIPLEEVDFSGNIDGLYVSGTISYIYDYYAETTMSSVPIARQYLIPIDDYYMGLYAPDRFIKGTADILMEASYAYANGWDDGTKLADAQFEVTGTINKLSWKNLKYYHDYLDWDNLDADTQAQFLPFVLEINHYGHLESIAVAILLMIAGILSFLFGLLFIPAIFGKSRIEKYVNQNEKPFLARSRVEDFLQNTPEFEKMRYDEEFICDNTGDAFGEITDLVWAYKKPGKYNASLMLGFIEGDAVIACVAEDEIIEEHLYNIEEFYPHVIIGHSEPLEKLYRENREEFLRLRYYKAGM